MLWKKQNKFPSQWDHYYYGRGKLLLSGEYVVLDGAKALALPASLGQSLMVRYSPSFNPTLYWKSFDYEDRLWFEARFEFWHFNCLDESPHEAVGFLQRVLRQVRCQNPHFLRDEVDVYVETRLEFPLDWGLGSSSTLIHNIAKWAYISPFELLTNVCNGSGYDVAAAQSDGPIIYEKTQEGPNWSLSMFNPPFKDCLYFLYSGRKQDSQEAIVDYVQRKNHDLALIEEISDITTKLEKTISLEDFEDLIIKHEEIIARVLGLPKFKERYATDFWGQIKSLGAWGGDFLLVTSQKSYHETKQYFVEKGFHVLIPYTQMIMGPAGELMNHVLYQTQKLVLGGELTQDAEICH